MPGNLTNVASLPLQFQKEIDKMVMKSYTDYEREYPKIAKVVSEKNFVGRQYTEAQIAGVGPVQEKGDGEGVVYDTLAEGNKHSVFAREFGLGFQVTRATLEDQLFGQVLKAVEVMGKQFAYRTDLDVMSNLAFGDNDSVVKAWDGKAPFASNHATLKSGHTINNTASDDLSETSLQKAFEYFFGSIYSAEGIPQSLTPNVLIVPARLYFRASQLLYQKLGVTALTAELPANMNDNQVNPSNKYVSPYQVMSSRLLNDLLGTGDEESWFLADSKALDVRLLWKRPFKKEQQTDFQTDNLMIKGTMRYAVGTFDYTGAYGSFAAGST